MSIQLAERKRVYLKFHPETAQGVAGANARWNDMQGTTVSVASFAKVCSEAFGYTERHIYRMACMASPLSDDEIRWLRGAPQPVSGKDLRDLAKMVNTLEPDQAVVLELIASTVPGRDTQTIIDGLMRITCLTAMLAGVQSENFAGGMKATWHHFAEQFNEACASRN